MGNFKMRCVDSKSNYSSYTNGKTYKVINGTFRDDANFVWVIKSFKEWNEWSLSEWELITENQISTKEELEDGDICVLRNGKQKAIVFGSHIIVNNSIGWHKNYSTNMDLTYKYDNKRDIMEVYRNKELIYKREEKSSQQIEIENIQSEMEKLNKRLEVLKGEM